MGPPTPESLAGMGLLGKKDSINTEILYLRDDAKRAEYFNKFQANNGDVADLKQVKWGLDSSPTSCGIRCNANIVLLAVGEKNSSICRWSQSTKRNRSSHPISSKNFRRVGY